MEESLPTGTPRTPELASSTVLETRVGGPAGTRLPLRPSRGGDFNACHFCPRSTGETCSLAPFIPTLQKTPPSTIRGDFPFLSRGCRGTIPLLSPLRTKTAVTRR